jgi:hypothetical protein
MQSYPIYLNNDNPSIPLAVDADLFVYESAQAVSRTNLLKFSSALDNAVWIKQTATVAPDKAVGTLGKTLDLVSGVAGSVAYVGQAYAQASVNAVHNVSAKMRQGTSVQTQIRFYDASFTSQIAQATINWNSGVPSVGSHTFNKQPQVIDLGGGLYQFAGVVTSGVAGIAVSLYPDVIQTGGTSYFGEVQVTEGAMLMPYQDTGATIAASADNIDTRIRVKADSGGEIVLKPGQRVRMGERAKRWYVSLFDQTAAATVNAIIGSGEFDDANTLNTFKLDGTFTNAVKITNDTATRVPVSLDVSQLVKIDPSIPLNIAGSTVQYTNSWVDASTAAATATTIWTPAQNVNGAYIEFAEISMAGSAGAGSTVVSLIAKSGAAPASATDGDVVMVATAAPGGTAQTNQANEKLPVRIKIPAGKGLYMNQTGNAQAATKTVLFTLL